MKRILIKDDPLGYSQIRYLINDSATSPYYEIWLGRDDENVNFVNPDVPSEKKELVRCLSGYPKGCKSVLDVIKMDMKERGYPIPENIEQIVIDEDLKH